MLVATPLKMEDLILMRAREHRSPNWGRLCADAPSLEPLASPGFCLEASDEAEKDEEEDEDEVFFGATTVKEQVIVGVGVCVRLNKRDPFPPQQ
jgi:hypothetical protein